MSRIFDVSSSTGLGIEGYLTCWKDELGNHTLGTKAQNMDQLRVFGLNNKPSTSCHWFLCFGTRRDTKPGHHALVRPDSRRQNLFFFTNRNILRTLKKEPLNIMLLHTSRTVWCLGRVPKHWNQWQEVEGLLFSPQNSQLVHILSFHS